jgi:hypothetical protein
MPLKLNSLVRNSEQGLAWRSRGLVRHTISPFPDLGNQFELHDTKEGEQKKNTPRIPSFLGNEDLVGGGGGLHARSWRHLSDPPQTERV